MTQITKKKYPGNVTVENYGYAVWSQMQYAVNVNGHELAFFSDKEDAHLFAKAKSEGLK